VVLDITPGLQLTDVGPPENVQKEGRPCQLYTLPPEPPYALMVPAKMFPESALVGRVKP